MKASLDTNVILHLYRANVEWLIFDRFSKGIVVHSFIRDIELERHGKDILERFDFDVSSGKIQVINDEYLKKIGMFPVFRDHISNEKILYNPQDMGEIYAIALARTLGIFALVTDDVKEYGPHYTLMRVVDGEIIPFSFYEVLFLSYLENRITADETIMLFNRISIKSNFNWNIRNKLTIFVKRFWQKPYTDREAKWMQCFCRDRELNPKEKLAQLSNCISKKDSNSPP